jgi:uncharacterized protein YegP (UPF0339 family)
MAKFQYYTDVAGEYRWRFRANNGEIIAMSSESYKALDSCKRSIEIIQTLSATATVEDKTTDPTQATDKPAE